MSAESVPARFGNRELSFLEFNQRIVEEARQPSVPLLERLKFAAIVGANLDEFFMVRVAGLKQQRKSGVLETGPDGMLPGEQLRRITARVSKQVLDVEDVLLNDLFPRLEQEGVRIGGVSDLDVEQRVQIRRVFDHQLFPMLTPLAVDPGHPFPLLKNRALNLAVHLLPEDSVGDAVPLLAVVQVPSPLGRFIDMDRLPESAGPTELSVVLVEDVIRHFASALFPGMRILECAPFRVLRNWDLFFDQDEQDDLLEVIRKGLRRRWRLDAVRLEVAQEATPRLVERLRTSLALLPADVQRHRAPLAWADLHQVLDMVGRSDLRDPPFQGIATVRFEEEQVFDRLKASDILLHHPYESYAPVLEFMERAAEDPQVLAIKQTLYRVNRDSTLLKILIRAAENGKQVTALVELQARFDEETNMEWARRLEESGVHVMYGLLGLKTHCNVAMVVRREPEGIRRYVHLGTGNYNEKTASIYSDLSFFTAREDVGQDVSTLFNLLTGHSAAPIWKKLTVAPLNLRAALIERIDAAARMSADGGRASLTIKTNALVDPETIQALVRAASAGARVVLMVRGPCTLLPGDEGVEVRNIVDRFLEHSRIFHFHLNGRDEVFLTSTDVMPRNFDKRVEVMVPVEDPELRGRIIDEILAFELRDEAKAAVLQPDGRFKPIGRTTGFRAQVAFMQRARQRDASRSS
ncbi:MAG: polyphosphate kinase 1 [Myxococcota bacterium]